MNIPVITITGPTACGKTSLAVGLAYNLGGEIISADSRQVFKCMDIGTGKDISEYSYCGVSIPYHLIDIREPGEEYSVYQFQQDFVRAYSYISSVGHQPIICGGTGLYIESVVKGYQLSNAPINNEFRAAIESTPDEVLVERLASYIKLHNHTDTETRERLVRALEIQEYQRLHPDDFIVLPHVDHLVVGILFPRDVVVSRIESRLRQRLEQGMVDEVRYLIDIGVPVERLLRYGLEYKHITRYLLAQCSYDEMFENLFTEIRRFSKRQMTWFRRMERGGIKIHWIDGMLPLREKISYVETLFNQVCCR